jgi:YbbR domain-containing protein
MKGFLKNWELKILALLAAVVLWFFVVGIENDSHLFQEEVEIQAINVPQGMSVANYLGKAKIRIRADQSLIKNLTVNDFDLSVDLKKAAEGEQTLPVTATSRNNEVTVLKVDPSTVRVVLESVIEKDVKLKVVVSGNPAKGYGVQEVQVTPLTVKVSGGKTLLAGLASINAEVKLDGTETANFKQNIILKLPETVSASGTVTLSPEQATVEVTVKEETQQKTLQVKPDLQGSVDLVILSQEVTVAPEQVTVRGKPEALEPLTEIKTEPVALEKLKDGPVKARLVLPAGISLPESQPNAVTISLTAP